MKTAKQLLEGFKDFEIDNSGPVAAGMIRLISQLNSKQGAGGVQLVDTDYDEDAVCVALIVNSQRVDLYFFSTDGGYLVVDWNTGKEPEVEFDLSDMNPPFDDGIIDISNVDKWFPVEALFQLILNPWYDIEESLNEDSEELEKRLAPMTAKLKPLNQEYSQLIAKEKLTDSEEKRRLELSSQRHQIRSKIDDERKKYNDEKSKVRKKSPASVIKSIYKNR